MQTVNLLRSSQAKISLTDETLESPPRGAVGERYFYSSIKALR